MKPIAITGIGLVTPSGIDKRKFWSNLVHGRSVVKKIDRFDASLYPSHIAGQVHELDAYSNVSSRLLKKIDLFSHMGLVASEMALQDAKLDLSQEDLKRAGIFMGNAIGGWLYAETELRDLYLEGREGVSPFMASAWFPAAPQGQISIHYGIKGYSKTIVSDRASSLMAIGYGAKNLLRGKNNFILAGGMEAPVTPYALLCCNTSGCLSSNNEEASTAYRPFDKSRDGFAIAEGAGILILEPPARVKSRGAHVYANIIGFGTTTDGVDRIEPASDGVELARAIKWLWTMPDLNRRTLTIFVLMVRVDRRATSVKRKRSNWFLTATQRRYLSVPRKQFSAICSAPAVPLTSLRFYWRWSITWSRRRSI